MKVNILAFFVLLIVQCFVVVQGNSTATGSTTQRVTTKLTKPSTKRTPTTTLTPEEECEKHNGSCSDCVGVSGAKCLYCKTDDSCKLYPSGRILPKSSDCDLSDARWGVCWLNFEALLIAMGVIGGIILVTITCCIYCCCCRGGNKKKYLKEEVKWERQKEERKQKSEERRADRKERMDEIRRKYGIEFKGLIKEDTPYQRFDA